MARSPDSQGQKPETRIFISYRRSGEPGLIGRLSDRLNSVYGAGNVFRDVSDLRTGEKFDEVIGKAVSQASVVIAAIGRDWAGRRLLRRSRIAEDEDWVRKELEHALASETPVIPVLLGDAALPRAGQLPASLKGLLSVHVGRLRDESWEADCTDLYAAIDAAARGKENGEGEVPFVWRRAEFEEPRRNWFALAAAAAAAVVAVGVLAVYLSRPDRVSLDDPTTWVAPPRSAARSAVAHLSLQLALLEMQASTRETTGRNDGFNVGKFTERFELQGVPWSAAFVTWCYLEALKREKNDRDASLPFADSPSTQAVAGSLRQGGWLIEPFDPARARPGDIVFFKPKATNRISHSEIVYAVSSVRLCSIGGNVSNKVTGECRPIDARRPVALGAIPAEAFE